MSTTLSPKLQTILDNRLRYLPEITGKAINSVDWSAKLIEIGHHYGLHIDEMEEFQGVVLKSMIGLISPEKFEDELIMTLALSPATTEKIIEDINLKILSPIHDYVMSQGKPADPMKTAGIEMTDDDTPIEKTKEGLPPLPRGGVATASSDGGVEPSVRFEDFFVTTPTTINHSLGTTE